MIGKKDTKTSETDLNVLVVEFNDGQKFLPVTQLSGDRGYQRNDEEQAA